MQWFYKSTGMMTDPIYTGKMFFGLIDLIQKDFFPVDSKIIAVHTGGLQGVLGYEEAHNTKIYN
jgi:1-aminocyclopropane-1-carboxylate deaminase